MTAFEMRGYKLTTLYWALEYSKVFLGYMFLMFIWPSVVFRKHLRGKGLTYHFSFCVTVQVVLINTLVLMLGLCHILNEWVVRILVYGMFLWSIFRHVEWGEKQTRILKHLITGTYGKKQFVLRVMTGAGRILRNVWLCFLRVMKGHWWEYGWLGIVLLYGAVYFTYGAFQDYSYGCGDMYPHNAWIYGLTKGQIFSAGVYPEGMHCYIYALHTLFGIRIYSCMLFVAGIHVLVFLVSAYVLMKEIFHWHYTPIFVLTAFLTVEVVGLLEICGMARLQWTIPQEFGMYTQFLCAAFLVKYLRSTKQVIFRGKLTKGYWDENLFVFMMSLAASLTIHFYPTIMAFFLCVCFIPVALNKVFHLKRFFPLIAAVICGFGIAVIPMAGALVSGIQFQGSIGWAVSIMEGNDEKSDLTQAGEQNTENIGLEGKSDSDQNVVEYEGVTGNTNQGEKLSDLGTGTVRISLFKRLETLYKKVIASSREKLAIIYSRGYEELYGKNRAKWIVGTTMIIFVMWFVYRFFAIMFSLIFRKRRINPSFFDSYFSTTLVSVLFMLLFCARAVGLPSLIAGGRLCSTEQMLILAMMMVPVDIVFTVLRLLIIEGVMKVISACAIVGIYLGTMFTGVFHGFLYYELTRYNGAVAATCLITESLPKESYTIVSTTDELYQLVSYGWHEELVTFVNSYTMENYTLPSQYIFIFVEKRPIKRSQLHFFSGPEWLAGDNYVVKNQASGSQCPNIIASEISEEAANVQRHFANHISSYSNLYTRTCIESKVYAWCQEFDKLYPNELKTLYEDDYFVCYYFEQEVQNLYRLGIMQ